MQEHSPLQISNRAAKRLSVLRKETNIKSTHILKVKALEDDETGMIGFNIYFEPKKAGETYYTEGAVLFSIDLNTALQLCGSELDCDDGTFIFNHESWDGHVPPTVEQVVWN